MLLFLSFCFSMWMLPSHICNVCEPPNLNKISEIIHRMDLCVSLSFSASVCVCVIRWKIFYSNHRCVWLLFWPVVLVSMSYRFPSRFCSGIISYCYSMMLALSFGVSFATLCDDGIMRSDRRYTNYIYTCIYAALQYICIYVSSICSSYRQSSIQWDEHIWT